MAGMCTCFSNTLTLEAVEAFFAAMADLSRPPSLPHAEFALGQDIVVIPAGIQRRLTVRPWGWKKPDGRLLANARSETVTAKPFFAPHADIRRCVIPADGFYESSRTRNGNRPWFFKLRSAPVFGLAGLMHADGNVVILTTEPNACVRSVHPRMPVILPSDVLSGWLDPEIPFRSLPGALFAPWPAKDMAAYSADGPKPSQPELF